MNSLYLIRLEVRNLSKLDQKIRGFQQNIHVMTERNGEVTLNMVV